MQQEFYRIKKLPPYVFAEVNNIKHKLRVEGKDIIDFGMGNPDHPTPQHIVEKLVETVNNPQTHRYSSSKGIPGLRKALKNYYQRRFNVELDQEEEVVVTIGSKEGIASLAKAITEPKKSTILVQSPCYPIHTWGFILNEAKVEFIKRDNPLESKESYINQLKTKLDSLQPKPIALLINYPCNPTTETATLDFYEEIVSICKHHEIFLISDIAYAEIYFDDTPTPSVLQVKGAKDIAIEFSTMSKTYSMPGWRVGFAAGNKTLIQAITKIKSYLDYGCFTPIQVAAAAALNGPQECVDEVRQLYKQRRDVLIDGLSNAGWNIEPPQASMFVWAPIPEKFKPLGSLEFSKQLLQICEVAVAPGVGFGNDGDNYVRIALVENRHRIRQACRSIKKFLT